MTEHHLDSEALVDLALEDLGDDERRDLLQHLAGCSQCREEYGEVWRTIDGTLAAAPRIEPSPGFDQRVLSAMNLATDPEAPTAPRSAGSRSVTSRSRRWALVAASVAAGLGIGTLGTLVAVDGDSDGDDSPSAGPAYQAARHVALTTGDGDRVGTVTRSVLDGEPVLVVDVSTGPEGKHYTCRLLLADGSDASGGEWRLESTAGGTWIVELPATDVVEVELVTDTGDVWSSAEL